MLLNTVLLISYCPPATEEEYVLQRNIVPEGLPGTYVNDLKLNIPFVNFSASWKLSHFPFVKYIFQADIHTSSSCN